MFGHQSFHGLHGLRAGIAQVGQRHHDVAIATPYAALPVGLGYAGYPSRIRQLLSFLLGWTAEPDDATLGVIPHCSHRSSQTQIGSKSQPGLRPPSLQQLAGAAPAINRVLLLLKRDMHHTIYTGADDSYWSKRGIGSNGSPNTQAFGRTNGLAVRGSGRPAHHMLGFTRRPCWAWKPRVPEAAGGRPATIRPKSGPASARKPCDRHAAGG